LIVQTLLNVANVHFNTTLTNLESVVSIILQC
jgi:hypothetical protein